MERPEVVVEADVVKRAPRSTALDPCLEGRRVRDGDTLDLQTLCGLEQGVVVLPLRKWGRVGISLVDHGGALVAGALNRFLFPLVVKVDSDSLTHPRPKP